MPVARSMIQVFLHWWLEQLASLVPAIWREMGYRVPDCILFTQEHAMVSAAVRRRGFLQSLGQFDTDRRGAAALGAALSHVGGRPLGAVLQPVDPNVLRKVVSLPLLARRNLRQVLEFELDHETPFRAEDVVWHYRICRIDRAAERIDVELLMVPRRLLTRACELAEAAGLRTEAVEIADSDGHMHRIGLSAASAHRQGLARHRTAALAVLLLGLALTTVVLPFVQVERSLLQTRHEVERLRAVAGEATELRRQIEQLSRATHLLDGERGRVRDPLTVLAAATNAVPDGSYLMEFSLHGERAMLVGLSPSSAELIPALAATKPFRDPTFGAPVVRPDGSKLELFTIGAALAVTNGGG
jgi:general secretion pathway protein L